MSRWQLCCKFNEQNCVIHRQRSQGTCLVFKSINSFYRPILVRMSRWC